MPSTTKQNSFPAGIIGALAGGIVIGLLIGLTSGMLINKSPEGDATPAPETARESENLTKIKPFFADHSAIVQGKIQAVNGNILRVEDPTGATVDLELDNPVYISRAGTSANPEPPTTDLKDIEIGINALVNLKEIRDQFKVISITMLPNLPTPKPLPSP